MKITNLIVALLAAGTLAVFGQEGTVQEIKHEAKKAGQKIKEGAETVGEKTKQAAETVGEKTKKTAETVGRKTKETVEVQVRRRQGLPGQLTENPEERPIALRHKALSSNRQISSLRLHLAPAVVDTESAQP